MKLTMRVDTVMPHVNLKELDDSLDTLANTALALPEGAAKNDLQATVDRLFAQRDAVRKNAEFDKVHVTFIDEDVGSRSIGTASFLIATGELKEGSAYRITAEEAQS